MGKFRFKFHVDKNGDVLRVSEEKIDIIFHAATHAKGIKWLAIYLSLASLDQRHDLIDACSNDADGNSHAALRPRPR